MFHCDGIFPNTDSLNSPLFDLYGLLFLFGNSKSTNHLLNINFPKLNKLLFSKYFYNDVD